MSRQRRIEETLYGTNPELASRQLEILMDDVGKLVQKQKKRLIDFALSFALTVEYHDQEIRTHLDRTRFWSVEISRRMGLSNLDDLEIGFLVHDVGKFMIDREIIMAPRPLSEAEWKIIKTHPSGGVTMMKDVVGPPALGVIRSHHERWDGTGYPQGLRGEKIPIGARVFAVPDVFDALTNVRPYRANILSFGEALKLIVKDRGSHFDPDVVDVFVDLMHELIEKGRATY